MAPGCSSLICSDAHGYKEEYHHNNTHRPFCSSSNRLVMQFWNMQVNHEHSERSYQDEIGQYNYIYLCGFRQKKLCKTNGEQFLSPTHTHTHFSFKNYAIKNQMQLLMKKMEIKEVDVKDCSARLFACICTDTLSNCLECSKTVISSQKHCQVQITLTLADKQVAVFFVI